MVETPLTADEMLKQMLQPQPPTTRPSVPTSMPPDTALEATSTVLPSTEPVTILQREGFEATDRTGQLTDPVDGPLRQFVFIGGNPALPAMDVLPNLKLMDLELQLTATTRPVTFVVSGTITEYRGHNYLLLDSGAETVPRHANTSQSTPNSSTLPVTADQMLHQLLATSGSKPPEDDTATLVPQSRPRHPAMVDDKSGSGAIAPDAPVLTVMREGTRIFDRVGRLTRHGQGQLDEFTFDSDRSTMQDPPLLILPNLKLGAMENAVSSTAKDRRFRVSGLITEYRGRNYILLEKAQVIPDTALLF